MHPPQLDKLHHHDVVTMAGTCAWSSARRVCFLVLCDETDRGRHNVLSDMLVAGQRDLGIPGLMNCSDW